MVEKKIFLATWIFETDKGNIYKRKGIVTPNINIEYLKNNLFYIKRALRGCVIIKQLKINPKTKLPHVKEIIFDKEI